MALHARAIVADVRLERKLCFEYAKLKAKSNLRSQIVRYAPVLQHESAEATSNELTAGLTRELFHSSHYRREVSGVAL